MVRLLLVSCSLLLSVIARANTIVVKSAAELNKAGKDALPGDIVVLQDGEWKNIMIVLNCKGTMEQPIIFKAQTEGKVFITGKSKLKLGGSFITVDGWNFQNGYAGSEAIITFRASNNEIANNCRVTNCSISNFTNPQRMDENYWVSFYGKNNRLDHNSFFNKKNMGVMIAVLLDDERSRENFHSIDHNYFAGRIPLASNSGEIIRVGVSQHCEFNSNTQITDNYFERCDGETEIVSIKSCSNVVRNNLFKECQGSVVLRHGHYNTVENNIFLGNNKPGTGGVRVINKGQWVVNNFFYQCTGTGFRAPLAVMNGVPNSPAFRYVAAQDAVIANNTFYQCTPLAFCEGSDAERSETPRNIFFLNNIIDNASAIVYNSFDKMDGFHFAGNAVNENASQSLERGFFKTSLNHNKTGKVVFSYATNSGIVIGDSLAGAAKKRLIRTLMATPGFEPGAGYAAVMKNAADSTGTSWTIAKNPKSIKKEKVNCKTAAEVIKQLTRYHNKALTINLTGKIYEFKKPVDLYTSVTFVGKQNTSFILNDTAAAYLFQLTGGYYLGMINVNADLASVKSRNFITTDTSGSSNHTNIVITNSTFSNYNGIFLNTAKSSVADSIIIKANNFSNNKSTLFNFMNETDKKGYYNVEKLTISNNHITGQQGQVLGMLRGGNDESTMGPIVYFTGNTVSNSQSAKPLIHFYGTQYSTITGNSFINANAGATLIKYEDVVKALHLFSHNTISTSGKVEPDQFTVIEDAEEKN